MKYLSYYTKILDTRIFGFLYIYIYLFSIIYIFCDIYIYIYLFIYFIEFHFLLFSIILKVIYFIKKKIKKKI